MSPRKSPPPHSLRLARFALALGLVCAPGCGLLRGPTTERTNFYVLTAMSQPDEAATGRRLVLGLGPLILPPYLNRPEMVTRVEANQLSFDEFNRWGEPLKDNFLGVLATDLGTLVGIERIIFYPWYANTPMNYAVNVAVLRFEKQPDGTAVLGARWAIGDGRGNVLVNRDSHFSRPAGSPAQTAAALSDLVGDLARDIAAALRQQDAAR